MPNMKDKIGNHNGKILSKKNELPLDVNGNVKVCCPDGLQCPLQPDRCDQKNVIYQAKVHTPTESNKVMIYYGSTEREFKKRCSEHKTSFRIVPKSHTALSTYIWKLKEKKTPYFVNWSIKARGHAFSDQNTMLNRRDELLEPCGHRRKHLLVSLFPPKKKEPPDTTVK